MAFQEVPHQKAPGDHGLDPQDSHQGVVEWEEEEEGEGGEGVEVVVEGEEGEEEEGGLDLHRCEEGEGHQEGEVDPQWEVEVGEVASTTAIRMIGMFVFGCDEV